MILRRFDSAAAAAHALAEEIAAALRLGVAQRGGASLAVPGGRTPVPLFHALRVAAVEWERIGITLTDERWVSEDHPASNAALVRRELLVDGAGRARFLPLFDGSAFAAGTAAAAWQSLQSLVLPFDAVVLGMGEDGHFASLFPGNADLDAALDVASTPGCVAMRAPVEPAERISLNLAALLQTRRLFLFITGKLKRELVLAAAHGDRSSQWPVGALLANPKLAAEVYWAP